ncbi:AMP-binding protein [Hanstruepera flava]|uniref:AMP-binding protein n=1 Tax=Hanstruepera flava TaxID=2930218 RepID=UPI002029744A|nr:AMP-binding protein [Hanstruepera flava]
MTPKFDKVHRRFKLNGNSYNHDALKEVAYSYIKEGEPFERVIGNFVADWLDHNDFIRTNTSGSTGKPKTIEVKKQAMVNSAIATGDYFNISPGDKALLCLPLESIAGKMMLVRAMMLGLELDIVSPSKFPSFDNYKTYDFSAMIPTQLYNSIERVSNIKTIIVGGAPVPIHLLKRIQNIEATVYETFGMTETVSHIAVRKLNHLKDGEQSNVFKLLPNIKISQDDRGCLVINAPRLNSETIVTNDVVNIIGKSEFEWLGRYDNVINSGGVKLYPETIEAKLQPEINQRFLVASKTDKELGEKLIMVLEGERFDIPETVFQGLDKYEKPKEMLFIPKFVETVSGKVQREKTLDLL